MRYLLPAAVVGIVAAAVLIPFRGTAARPEPFRHHSGIEKRELWTTSKVKGSPEPPDPYRMVRVYPMLKFNEALEIARRYSSPESINFLNGVLDAINRERLSR